MKNTDATSSGKRKSRDAALFSYSDDNDQGSLYKGATIADREFAAPSEKNDIAPRLRKRTEEPQPLKSYFSKQCHVQLESSYVKNI